MRRGQADFRIVRFQILLQSQPRCRHKQPASPQSHCICSPREHPPVTLDHESLDLVLERADLAHEVGGLVGGDAAGDDSAADTAGTAESHLAGDVDLESQCQSEFLPQASKYALDSRKECSCPRREAAGGGGWLGARCRRPG